MRVDSTNATLPDGTVLSGEVELGLDDVVEKARIEFDVRMGERNHVRVGYFKLDRFQEVQLDRGIAFGDFDFLPGDRFRTDLDYRQLSLNYTYSLFRGERFEAGLGLGLHIFEMHAEGSEPSSANSRMYGFGCSA